MADTIRLYKAAGVWMAEFSDDGSKAPTPWLAQADVWTVTQAISQLNPGTYVYSTERN